MIRQARPEDFSHIFPLLNLIFDEMDMQSIKKIPEDQFYDLMKLGFYSENYRYSYRRILVYTDSNNIVIGILVMYSYRDQSIIDFMLKRQMPKVGLPIETTIFKDKEAMPHEWYYDAIAVNPKYQGKGIGGKLLRYGFDIAKKKGFKKVSLNVDFDNPRAEKLYAKLGFKTSEVITIGNHKYHHMIKELK